jgi:BirA family biotin operon repressor/biotin-[acetyl-CoA-carboxylase] ligase
MDEARRLAEQEAPEGTVVIAEEQTAGRGRFDRSWISPRGQNLSFSVMLRPTATQLPFMNMAATLAVSEALAELTGLVPTIKWPNDVRINGLKASGILIETSIEGGMVGYAIVGIGLNVNFDPSEFPEIAPTATSIIRETGQEADRTEVLRVVLEHFDDLYRAVKEGRSLTEEWSARLETLGRTVQIRWRDTVMEGRAESVDEQGNLVLTRADGSTFTAVAGEVTLQV